MIQSRRDDDHAHETGSGKGLTIGLEARPKLRRLELTAEQLHRVLGSNEVPDGLITICARCQRVRDRDGRWHAVEAWADHVAEVCFSHGLCGACATALYGVSADVEDTL